ncbi:MAG: phosphomannomutase/phosphoglucomutase [bacterium]
MINPKIFKEYDIRGQYPDEIDEDATNKIGQAFASKTKAKKIIIARDLRPESQKILKPLIAGLQSRGAKIYDLGVTSTPGLFFAVGAKQFPAGVMITASHNPKGYTGLKLCVDSGLLLGMNTGLKEIKLLAEKKDSIKDLKQNKKTATIPLTIENDYKKFVFSIINKKYLSGLKVALDASDGSGAKLATAVFAETKTKNTKINFRPNDGYKDHGLNPLLPENQLTIKTVVKKTKAHLGVIFDGDADRCIFIDEAGQFVEPYYINCLLSRIMLEKFPKLKITVDARLTLGIKEIISQNGGQPIVSRSGYANIISTMQKKKLLFGCENSGHYMFNFALKKGGRHYAYGDAILPALIILEFLGKSQIKLSEAIKPLLTKYPISGEINMPNKIFSEVEKKITALYKSEKISHLDGLSIQGSDFFINIRPSKTEPLVRLNIEAKNKTKLEEVKNKILKII